jgi:hypothetical protein
MGQGTFKEKENHQYGANSKRPDEDASAFQKGIHWDTLNPTLQSASPLSSDGTYLTELTQNQSK